MMPATTRLPCNMIPSPLFAFARFQKRQPALLLHRKVPLFCAAPQRGCPVGGLLAGFQVSYIPVNAVSRSGKREDRPHKPAEIRRERQTQYHHSFLPAIHSSWCGFAFYDVFAVFFPNSEKVNVSTCGQRRSTPAGPQRAGGAPGVGRCAVPRGAAAGLCRAAQRRKRALFAGRRPQAAGRKLISSSSAAPAQPSGRAGGFRPGRTRWSARRQSQRPSLPRRGRRAADACSRKRASPV